MSPQKIPIAGTPPTAAKADWKEVVFVCRKCSRAQPEGADGHGTPLRKWLKRELKARGLGKRIRVVDSGCLDLCPKRGVTLARGSELMRSKPLRVHRAGDDPERLIEWLLLPPEA